MRVRVGVWVMVEGEQGCASENGVGVLVSQEELRGTGAQGPVR